MTARAWGLQSLSSWQNTKVAFVQKIMFDMSCPEGSHPLQCIHWTSGRCYATESVMAHLYGRNHVMYDTSLWDFPWRLLGSNTEVSIIVLQWAATLQANHSLVFPGTSWVVSSVHSGHGAAAHHLRFCHVTGKTAVIGQFLQETKMPTMYANC